MEVIFKRLLDGLLMILCCPVDIIVRRENREWERQHRERTRLVLPEEREARQKTCDDNAPIPLPFSRPRNLTLPLPRISTELGSLQYTKEQLQSTFFTKLPVEVRLVVYRYVLVGSSRTIHVIRKQYKRLGHFRCNGSCNI